MRSESSDLRLAMVDSNIFVYALDLQAGEKREIAKRLTRRISIQAQRWKAWQS